MTRPSPSPARRALPARAAALAGLALLTAGCLAEPAAQTCATGIYCPAGTRCAARQAVCLLDDCGDGAVQGGEVCDDGNVVDGDGCSRDCRSNEICGNGRRDVARGEACDDGNREDGDGCSGDCLSTEQCGNGFVDPGSGEECDPGVVGSITPTCLAGIDPTADCKRSRHGDGWVNPLHDGEVCDRDGLGTAGFSCEFAGTVAGAYLACNSDCTPSVHGDGKVNRSDGEDCDGNGDGVPTGRADCRSATCNADCSFSRCGDGAWNPDDPDEPCDDGNPVDTDACRNTCQVARCGDGVVRAGTEECDLGDGVNGAALQCPYGQPACQTCSETCTWRDLTGPYCGDGSHDVGFEACDSQVSRDCRTCIACADVAPANPTGSITLFSAPADGDTITVDDGVGGTLLLEFDADGACTAASGKACVDVEGLSSTALAIRAALTGASTLRVDPLAVTSDGPNPIQLETVRVGFSGNMPIEVSGPSVVVAPLTGPVVVEGMADGVGCRRNMDCARAADCVAPFICKNGKCESPPPP